MNSPPWSVLPPTGARTSLHVRHLVAYGGMGSYCEEIASRELLNANAQEVRRVAVTRGIDIFLPDRIPEANSKTCMTDASRVRNPAKANPYCMLPWFQATIDWNGDYRVYSLHTVGNLREQSFDEIYNSPKMREIRRQMLQRSENSCSWNCHQEAYDVPEELGDA